MRTIVWMCAAATVALAASTARANEGGIYGQSLGDGLSALLTDGRKDALSARQRRACARVDAIFDRLARITKPARQASYLGQRLRKLERISRGSAEMTLPVARTTSLLLDAIALHAAGLKGRLEDGDGSLSPKQRQRAFDGIRDLLEEIQDGFDRLNDALGGRKAADSSLRDAIRHLKRAIVGTKRVAARVGSLPAVPCEGCRPLGPGESATLTFEVGGMSFTAAATHVLVKPIPEGLEMVIEVIGDGVTVLDSLEVTIIVPPDSFGGDPQAVVGGPYGPEIRSVTLDKQMDSTSPALFVSAVIQPRGPGGPTLRIEFDLRQDL